ncbi:MAG: CDP-diacylglycerol--glycerol-3-phosphate 3-phosphatidyltransferase, partial [Micrococcales bacterium]|nr:CDP-diacylglycerol--glycerol-3-phosphate 3-phosphatidyltransferase [Micrococcales bacterium]
MTTSQAATAAKPPVVNIANAVTVLRLLLVPVFVWVFYQGRHGEVVWTLVTVGVFLAAAATDRLDGYLARTRGLVTDFGKIADPIVDKILIAAGLICLWLNNSEVSLMVVLVILLRELIVTVIRLAVVRKRVIAASAGGKLKTFLQVTAICMYILLRLVPDSPWATTGVTVTMIVTVAVTVYTGLEYIYQAWPYLVKRSKPKPVSPSADVTKATVAAGPAKSAVHPDRPVEGWDETRSVPQEPRAPGERGSTTTVLQAPSWAAVERPAEGLASTKGKAAAKGQPKTPAVAAKPPKAAAGSGGVPAASAARAGIPIVMADAPPGGLAAPAKAGSTRPVAVPAASAARAGIPIVMADAPPGGLAAPAKAGSA